MTICDRAVRWAVFLLFYALFAGLFFAVPIVLCPALEFFIGTFPGSYLIYRAVLYAGWGLLIFFMLSEAFLVGVPNFLNGAVLEIIGYRDGPSDSTLTIVSDANILTRGAPAVRIDPGQWPYRFYFVGMKPLTVALPPGDHIVSLRARRCESIEIPLRAEASRHYRLEYQSSKNRPESGKINLEEL